jgi:hypothetical protein
MSSGNIVHDNIIKSPTSSGIQVNTGAAGNTFYHNTILDAPTIKLLCLTSSISKKLRMWNQLEKQWIIVSKLRIHLMIIWLQRHAEPENDQFNAVKMPHRNQVFVL